MRIIFDGEAAETFSRFLNELANLAGEVTTVDGETFDCMMIGYAPDHGWHDAAEVRRWDFDADRAVLNGTEIVRVESFRVF